MATLEETLKKLNKTRAEGQSIQMADKTDLSKKTTSTGSPYLNLLTGGGYAKGGLNLLVADGGTGKSSKALMAIKEEQEATGRIGVYYDGEGTLEDSYIERMGVDRTKLLVVKGRNLEEMLDSVELFSKADDVGVIVIDSIPIFVSSVVEAKSAGDNNMAVEARKYTARMPIIEANCMGRDITLIGITSYKLDPGAMGDPRKLPRGLWQYTMANLILDITKKDIVKDDLKNPIGHVLDVRVKKSKLAPYNPKDVFSVNFYYNGGYNKIEEFVLLFLEKGIIHQGGGGNYTYPNKDGEELKSRGKDVLMEDLKEDKETFEYLISLL
jgi:recombination protein RecA